MREESKVAAAVLAVLLAAAVLAPAAHAQQQSDAEPADLGRLYRRARIDAVADRLARRPMPPARPVRLSTPRLDSLRAWVAATATGGRQEENAPRPRIRERRAVLPVGTEVFERRFADVEWAYLGRVTGPRRTALDTMQTRRLRARLQARYGDPTRTVVDTDSLMGGRSAGDYIQFEYWLVANDTIPLKVVDPGGPFDRGLVVSAPARYRERLPELRAAVFAPLLRTRRRAPYVDYYYDPATETWYRTGFDGERFFTVPADRRDVVPGRRPTLRRGRRDAGP
ncbi:MAG: hypothetical protein BRD46_04335 [Bacteroidetes bacterium QS_8_68_15]|nr:MAG: hypothetical protein BRD46_04335 [Bacteroidetes bacterium QS_8_68_15]